jgi:hypothetical protein
MIQTWRRRGRSRGLAWAQTAVGRCTSLLYGPLLAALKSIRNGLTWANGGPDVAVSEPHLGSPGTGGRRPGCRPSPHTLSPADCGELTFDQLEGP